MSRRQVTLVELLLYELEQVERQAAMERKPTHGQQRILLFAGRANRRLRGHRDVVTGETTYQIIELAPTPFAEPRVVQMVTSVMVQSLVDAGWLEVYATERHTGGPRSGLRRWEYRVTEAGVWAANGASEPQTRGEQP